MKAVSRCLVGLAMTGVMWGTLASTAGAHHSRQAFDTTRDVTLIGIVKRFEWTNPHTYLYIDVTDDQGKVTEWGIEFAAVGQLIRRGFTPQTFKPGAKVKAVGNIARDPNEKLMLMKEVFGFSASGTEVPLPTPKTSAALQ